MFTNCICISPCRSGDYKYNLYDLYSYRNVVDTSGELVGYAMYKYSEGYRHTTPCYVGILKVNFKRSNFMDFGAYCMLLNEVDKMYEKTLWDI